MVDLYPSSSNEPARLHICRAILLYRVRESKMITKAQHIRGVCEVAVFQLFITSALPRLGGQSVPAFQLVTQTSINGMVSNSLPHTRSLSHTSSHWLWENLAGGRTLASFLLSPTPPPQESVCTWF